MSLDQKIRLAAFKWLSEQVSIHGDVLPRKLLEKGFVFEDNRISLISPQGIFKPKIMDYPLTITTAPKGRMMIVSTMISSYHIVTGVQTQIIAITLGFERQ